MPSSDTFKHILDQLSEADREILLRLLRKSRVRRAGVLEEDKRTISEKLSDKLAEFGGSWAFVVLCLMAIFGWMTLNTKVFKEAYDPYPFILLNLVLSCLAALQAPIILMSQNRQTQRDRQQADFEFEINLRAELEIRALSDQIKELRSKLK